MTKATIHVAKFALKTSAGRIAAGAEILPETHKKLFTEKGNPTKELKALVEDYGAVTTKEVTVLETASATKAVQAETVGQASEDSSDLLTGDDKTS
ncbi:hypothetical protein [uncultured Cohaesibacter sp.]|uniref:hypothetical protein n=1 Tax=uncultured Cohaesibacter sp. TaxID=1002546 RepID=UPI002AAA690A|nr:hypothetical protein [uncultured Cohaesibacter sp.]